MGSVRPHSGQHSNSLPGGKVGRHGTIVIPARLRRRFGLDTGTSFVAEEREDGVLLRRAVREPIDHHDREHLLQETNRAYAALRADPRAWREELARRSGWDAALGDGLDDVERWTDDDRLPVQPPAALA